MAKDKTATRQLTVRIPDELLVRIEGIRGKLTVEIPLNEAIRALLALAVESVEKGHTFGGIG